MSKENPELERLRVNAEALQNMGVKLYDSVLGLDPATAAYLKKKPDPEETRKLLAEIIRCAAQAEGYLSAWEG